MINVALINSAEIEFSPYIDIYIDIFNQVSDVNLYVIEWRRSISSAYSGDFKNVISYHRKSSLKCFKIFKLFDYIRFSNFVRDVVKKAKIDKLVVVDYVIAFFLKDLLKKYSTNYLIDIRDYYSVTKYIKRSIKLIDERAYGRIISSKGFDIWLNPIKREVVCHNTSLLRLNKTYPSHSFFNKKISILTIGQLSYYETDSKLIESLSDKDNIEFNFNGLGIDSEKFKNLSKTNPKVHYFGKYKKQDEEEIALKSDFINITLCNKLSKNTAMANRFYLSVICGVPMIVNNYSIQAEYVKKYHLGIILDSYQNIGKQIDDYILIYNSDIYTIGRKSMLRLIENDFIGFKNLINNFIE